MADPIKIIVKPNQSGIIFTGTTQATTASNVGVGEGVYKQKVVNNLEFKSLSGDTNVTITDLGDTLLIQSSGGSGGGTWGTITGTLSDQTDLQTELDEISGLTETNTGNIGTNASNISGNAADIVTLSGETINKLDDVVAGANISIDKTDPLNPIISTVSISGVTDGVTSGATLAGNAVLSLQRTIGLSDVNVDLSPLSGASAWGDITGTLSDQTDLQAELDTLNNGITGNTADILSNSGLISLNAGNISDNAADIQLVSGQTDTNTSDIANNVSGLATISGQTDTNTSGIADNVSGLATISGQTDSNTSDITTLSGETINKLDSVVEGTLVSVDNSDPLNPIINVTGGTVAWGLISGTLSDQTDLQGELDTISGLTETNATNILTKADKNATTLSKTTGYTVTEGDNNKIIECDGTFNLTFPTGLTAGWQCIVNSIGTGTTTLVADGTMESTIFPDLVEKFAGATVYQRASGIFTAFGGFGVSGETTTTWGNIIGTLSDQTDLQAALDTISGATDTNTAGLGTISGQTDTNTAGLGTISGQTDTNTSGIATNVSGLATISGQTDTNTSDIATNVNGLATISGQTDTNTASILTKADLDLTILSVTGTTSLVQGDDGKIIEVTATGASTLTMSSGVTTGWNVTINNVGGGVITVAAEGTLQSKGSAVTLANQYGAGTVYHRGSNVFSLFGDLT